MQPAWRIALVQKVGPARPIEPSDGFNHLEHFPWANFSAKFTDRPAPGPGQPGLDAIRELEEGGS